MQDDFSLMAKALALPASATDKTTNASRILRHSWSEFYRNCFPDPTQPPKQWELDVAGFLWERGYAKCEALCVLDHAGRHGSVDCCPVLIDPFDRAEVERKLPDCPDGEWERGEMSGNWSLDLRIDIG